MSYVDKIFQLGNEVLAHFNRSPSMTLLASGTLGRAHYVSVLREIFHYVRENPGLQTLAGSRFRGERRAVLRKFYQHATSEIGHEQLAIADLKVLGVDTSRIPFENPLPTTLPLIAFPYYQIQCRNPIGYLGCMLFLEWMPTQSHSSRSHVIH
jgi:hypothetical protein